MSSYLATPLSSIDTVFQPIPTESRYCFLDTNVLIAAFYDVHEFNDEATFIFEKLADLNIKPFVSVTTRYEFLDFVRRVLLTENLFSMTSSNNDWRISSLAKREIENAKRYVDTLELPVLPDARIKKIKQHFIPKTESGNTGWLKISSGILENKLSEAWDVISENLKVTYFDTQNETIKSFISTRPEWQNLHGICSQTAIGTADAMILNIFESSTVPVLISFDYDLGYAFRARKSTSKTLLLHDRLSKKLNKLRFPD